MTGYHIDALWLLPAAWIGSIVTACAMALASSGRDEECAPGLQDDVGEAPVARPARMLAETVRT
jgi:hypothetical protein